MSKDYLMAKFYDDSNTGNVVRVGFLDLMPEDKAVEIAIKNMRDDEFLVDVVRVTAKEGKAPPRSAMLQ